MQRETYELKRSNEMRLSNDEGWPEGIGEAACRIGPYGRTPVSLVGRGHVSVAPPICLPRCPTRPYGITFTLKDLVTAAPAASVTRYWKDLAPSWPTDGVQVNRPVDGLMAVGPNGAVPVGGIDRAKVSTSPVFGSLANGW